MDLRNKVPFFINHVTQVADWEKPTSWPDIRKGAQANSVYFLVAHSADYTKYNDFPVACSTVGSGTYDVYIDGVKIYSEQPSADSTALAINWQTLGLSTGYDVTYPEALRAHIVRITPTNSSETIKTIRCQYSGSQKSFGILWVHFSLNYAVGFNGLLGSWNGSKLNPICEAITAANDKLSIRTGYGLAGVTSYSGVKTMPIIEGSNIVYDMATGLGICDIKKIRLKNINAYNCAISYAPNLRRIETENCSLAYDNGAFRNCPLLENLPPNPSYYTGSTSKDLSNLAAGCVSLRPTTLDFSGRTNLEGLRFGGTSAAPLNGIKGVIVPSSAPFTSSTSPQINVNYTGLDRNALVTLFNSLPYNVGYTVTGTPTISSGVVSGFDESSHLNISDSLDITQNLEFVFKLKFTAYSGLFFGYSATSSSGFSIESSHTIHCWLISNANYKLTGLHQYNLNTDYYIKLVKNSDLMSLYYSTDGVNYTLDNSKSISSLSSTSATNIKLGSGNNGQLPFNGSIYLNNTYIKVNGAPWFTGKAAMTKTLSIVGCAGTSSLTADDKAIATDKGWSLTLS